MTTVVPCPPAPVAAAAVVVVAMALAAGVAVDVAVVVSAAGAGRKVQNVDTVSSFPFKNNVINTSMLCPGQLPTTAQHTQHTASHIAWIRQHLILNMHVSRLAAGTSMTVDNNSVEWHRVALATRGQQASAKV